MLKSIFSETGIGGSGFLLIIAGIFLANIDDMTKWGAFCITLGISLLFFILASKVKGILQIIVAIIGGGSFVAAIVLLLNAL